MYFVGKSFKTDHKDRNSNNSKFGGEILMSQLNIKIHGINSKYSERKFTKIVQK
jgi:hypothetical protein